MGSRPSRVSAAVAPVQIEATQSEGSPRKDACGEGDVQSERSASSEEESSDSGSEYGVVAENFQIYKVELLEEKLAEAEGRLNDAEGRNRRAEQVGRCRVCCIYTRVKKVDLQVSFLVHVFLHHLGLHCLIVIIAAVVVTLL